MKRTLLAIILAATSASASADSWLYMGMNVGAADFTDTSESDETAFGVNIGTGILPFIGVEAGYWDFGSVAGSDLTSAYIGIKPSINFGPIELYAKAGLNKYNVTSGREFLDDDDYDSMYGVGVEYTILDAYLPGALSIGAAYNRFGFDKFDIDTYTLAATYHFL